MPPAMAFCFIITVGKVLEAMKGPAERRARLLELDMKLGD